MTSDAGNNSGRRFGGGRHSLFFKLLAILLGALIVILLVLGVFFRSIWNPDTRETTRQNLRHYVELLTDEIGVPPDTAMAERLSVRLKIGIAIRRPDETWWFSPRIPDPMRARIQSRPVPDSVRARVHKGRTLAIVPRDGHVFVYGSRRRQPAEIRPKDWFFLLGTVAGIGFVAWLLLRRLLLPVRDLSRGVREVGAGNLDVRLPERGRDELGELALAFNAMTHGLKERLRARDQLLLDVSHELRSPLTRMRVALEMAEPGAAVDSLREEITALDSMITEVLESERLQSGPGQLKKEPTDLVQLISEVIAEQADTGPGVSWRAPEGFSPVPCDAERVRRVVRNLIANALKYGGGAGSPVEVSLRREAGPRGGEAVLEVRDYGPGIPDTEKKLVFEPFYRVDRSRSQTPGYGLGLPLCKRILTAHGGDIAIADAPGGGTVVRARLPLEERRVKSEMNAERL